MSLRVRCSSTLGAPCRRQDRVFVTKRVSLKSFQAERRRLHGREGLNLQLIERAVPRDLNGSIDPSLAGPNKARDLPFPRTYRRVLLKISGEALQSKNGCGIDAEVIRSMAKEIAQSWNEGFQIAIVVGGGNFFRGADAFEGLDRATADYVGMLATTMNGACLQSVLESFGVETRLQTAIEIREVAEPYIRRKAIRHLEKGRVVIFGAGTGKPFFTTDTAAALRAAEIGAEEILKATKVDGVYSSDPCKDPDAKQFEFLTYDHALMDSLQFMDTAALSLCRDQSIPIHVFNVFEPGNILKAIRGDPVGTFMRNAKETTKGEPEPIPFTNGREPKRQSQPCNAL